jgi:hypothetical protein
MYAIDINDENFTQLRHVIQYLNLSPIFLLGSKSGVDAAAAAAPASIVQEGNGFLLIFITIYLSTTFVSNFLKS